MKTERGTRFAQKVDWWMWLVITGGAAEMMLTGWLGGNAHSLVGLIVGVSMGALVLAVFLPPMLHGYCLLTDDLLLIRQGLYTARIRCEAIVSVEETRFATACLAFSLDRLGITYRSRVGNEYTVIALRDKEGFFTALQMKNPATVIKRRQKRR